MNDMLTKLFAAIQIERSELTGLPQNSDGITHATITRILQLIFGLSGGIALIIITLAGLKYVISQGNPQETAKAKDTILYALVGLVITMSAFAIVTFAIGRI
jgi:hypothetical protein